MTPYLLANVAGLVLLLCGTGYGLVSAYQLHPAVGGLAVAALLLVAGRRLAALAPGEERT